jgi:hypothetical protein
MGLVVRVSECAQVHTHQAASRRAAASCAIVDRQSRCLSGAPRARACSHLVLMPVVAQVAATLRPETMYGQTNCYVLPTGTYGAFAVR